MLHNEQGKGARTGRFHFFAGVAGARVFRGRRNGGQAAVAQQALDVGGLDLLRFLLPRKDHALRVLFLEREALALQVIDKQRAFILARVHPGEIIMREVNGHNLGVGKEELPQRVKERRYEYQKGEDKQGRGLFVHVRPLLPPCLT